MAQTLSITPATWATGTARFFTRGRSTALQAIDTALDHYVTQKALGWNSAGAQAALEALGNAIDAWKDGRGLKSNGNIASCRDSKGLVTRLRSEVSNVLDEIAASPAGKERRAKAMHDRSVQQAVAASSERQGGGRYIKDSGGGFKKAVFNQEQNNSCACACACTFASYLSDVALREDVFRQAYDDAQGAHHDFNTVGTMFPPIEAALLAVGVDAKYVATGDYPALATALRKATTSLPILFGVSWGDGSSDQGSHAVMCKGVTQITTDTGQAPGFLIEDPWPTHGEVLMFDDGTYWVKDSNTGAWSSGYANPVFGYVHGKRAAREVGRMTRGVKLTGM